MSIKVNWFIPVTHRDYNRMAASIWIRCLQLLPYLEEYGMITTINEPDAQADIVVFVRSQDEATYQTALQQKSAGKKIIFDLCVNYFDSTGVFERGYGVEPERIHEVLRMLDIADVITCASANIAQRAQEFHPWVVYLSDSIDPRHFRYAKALEDFDRPGIRAIWSGYSAKAYELEPLLPLLKSRKIDLVLISEQAPQLRYPWWLWKRKLAYRFWPWQYETFPKYLLNGECCISYRAVDNPYNRGHSVFKIGIFMAQGIPAIASPVPAYVEAITKTSGGKICYSLADWKNILDHIIEDRQSLKTWSRQARKIMENYSTKVIAQKYAELFQQVCR